MKFKIDKKWETCRNITIATNGKQCMCCKKNCEGNDITVDHIYPRSKFKQLMYTLSNLQILCRRCNSRKGTNIKDYRDIKYKIQFDVQKKKKFVSKRKQRYLSIPDEVRIKENFIPVKPHFDPIKSKEKIKNTKTKDSGWGSKVERRKAKRKTAKQNKIKTQQQSFTIMVNSAIEKGNLNSKLNSFKNEHGSDFLLKCIMAYPKDRSHIFNSYLKGN